MWFIEQKSVPETTMTQFSKYKRTSFGLDWDSDPNVSTYGKWVAITLQLFYQRYNES